jgi:hypothetical protein
MTRGLRASPRRLPAVVRQDVWERERRGPSRAGLARKQAGKARQHNSRRPRCCHDGGTARQHRPSICCRDALGAHAAGRRREERRCRSVLAAVENQNSHTCDLDPRRLGRKPCKGRGSALTAEAHWLGRGYKLTPDTRALAGERVLPVPVAAPDVAACSHPYHAPLTIA